MFFFNRENTIFSITCVFTLVTNRGNVGIVRSPSQIMPTGLVMRHHIQVISFIIIVKFRIFNLVIFRH